jgi:hypothetical protein
MWFKLINLILPDVVSWLFWKIFINGLLYLILIDFKEPIEAFPVAGLDLHQSVEHLLLIQVEEVAVAVGLHRFHDLRFLALSQDTS